MEAMATRDDVTVRIDTELRAKARDLGINLSRLLEEKLAAEIDRVQTVAKTLEGSEEIRLDLEDYIGKFTGKFIGEGHDVQAYLTDDERLILYQEDRSEYVVVEDLDDLDDWFPHDPDVIAQIRSALGEAPREIDI